MKVELLRAADEHTCSECTQKYKETADIILPEINETQSQRSASSDNMDIDHADVTMVVVDGIVTGPIVSNTLFEI